MDNSQTSEYEGFLIIPEDVVMFCSEQIFTMYGKSEENAFKDILDAGVVFKQAGLTPVYLCREDMKNLCVTTMEKIRKNYH